MSTRATWTGTISFGLVSVPVQTVKAVDAKDVKFNTFHITKDGEAHPMGRKEIDKETGEEIPRADQTRAWKMPDGSIVPVSDEELVALAPEKNKTVEITKFVYDDEIPPLFFEKHEWVVPQKGGEKAYALLLAGMTGDEGDYSALGTTVRGTKEHHVAIHARQGLLMLSFLNAADEVRDGSELGVSLPDVNVKERSLAKALVASMAGEWDEKELHDSHRENVMALIESKSKGEAVALPQPVEAVATVDLMEALQASLDEAAK